MGPVTGGHAHGAGFATGIERAVVEVMAAECLAGVADGNNLGMRGGIIVECDLIMAFGNDAAIFYYDGTKRTAVVLNRFTGQFNGALNEGCVLRMTHRVLVCYYAIRVYK